MIQKLGRYELIRVLGKGAMGLVYEGRDPNLDRRVAIKTIKVENLSEEAAAEYEVRFRTEAHSAARLQHPNIVSVYDSDRDGDMAYLVMEFIQGEDLKYHLDQGALYTLEQTLGIMRDLLSALEYAHAQSIVHRDIKPANLLIEKNGRVKLTDFGVARIQDSGESTRTQGTMVGTLKYMSPEQVQGRPVDARADIFAAGIVLYQLLTGKRPFDGSTDFAIIQQIVGHEPAAPTFFNTRLPPAIDAVVSRSLAKAREQRYASAREFIVALEAASREAADPTVVPPVSPRVPGMQSTWTSTARPAEPQAGLQSGTGVSPSTVTQEIELVYWKDIKDSTDVEDIRGFMAKFPSGIYADLARRRLRKLGVVTGDESDIGTALTTGTMVLPRHAGSYEPTMHLARGSALPGAVPPAAKTGQPPKADKRVDAPAPDDAASTVFASTSHAHSEWAQTQVAGAAADGLAAELAGRAARPTAGEAVPVKPFVAEKDVVPAGRGPRVNPVSVRHPAAAKSRLWLAAVAGVVLVVGAGLVVSRFMPAGSPGVASAVSAAPSATAPGVDPTGAAGLPAPVAAPAVVVADPPAAVIATEKPMTELKTAAEEKAAAKKAASDKHKRDRHAAAASAPEGAPPVVVAEPEPVKRPPPPAPAPAPTPVVAASPRQACENRILLGFQICMAEQCARRAFTNHPLCVERRAMEERRREFEQSR